MSHTVLQPEVSGPGTGNGRWMVLIFNNETNSMDEVIEVLMRATGCDLDEAYMEMWEAHTYGKAPVHFAPRADCDDAAAVISAIGVKTEVAPEWED